MDAPQGSLLDLTNRLRGRDEVYLDLLTAKTEEEFNLAFDALLQRAIMHLERNKKLFKDLPEDGISAVLVAWLEAPGLNITQQRHSNGHVDLTVEAYYVPAVKLGEAKIYDGPEYHIKGLAQLLGRYTTGREIRGLLIVYVKKARVSDLVLKLRNAMDQQLPENQVGTTRNHSMKWSFLSSHLHSSGETLEVGHVACNLFVDSGDSEPTTPEA